MTHRSSALINSVRFVTLSKNTVAFDMVSEPRGSRTAPVTGTGLKRAIRSNPSLIIGGLKRWLAHVGRIGEMYHIGWTRGGIGFAANATDGYRRSCRDSVAS